MRHVKRDMTSITEPLHVRSRKYCRRGGGGVEYNTLTNYKILSNLMRIFN